MLPETIPLRDRPQFAKGVYVQEVFAGWGGWTQGMLHQGFRANPPARALIMTFGTPPPEPDCSKWLRRHRMLTFPTCGSGARLAPPFVTFSVSTEVHAQPFAPKAMGLELMRCKATTSPSSPANFVWSCARPGESSALRAAPHRVVILKSGICHV